MTTSPAKARALRAVLWASLALYFLARICQLFADRLPSLLIVVLHVVPPAIFALVHGSILYRVRAMAIFMLLCLGIGGASEVVSLRTGFPFGHYTFTNVMGPKILGLPLLLVLAYLGIGYCSWVLSLLILGDAGKRLSGFRIVTAPLLAAFVMVAWDLSMEADWSTVDRAWIWWSGGPIYGVPVSNFLGWYLTAFLIFQAFAIFSMAGVIPQPPASRWYWYAAILLYLVCAVGNLLILALPMAPPVVTDPTGRQWLTHDILLANAAVSLFVMVPLAFLAWLRMKTSLGQQPLRDAIATVSS